MKKSISILILLLTITAKAQLGVPQIVNDPEANTILKTISSQQMADNSKALIEAKNTVMQIDKQSKWITDAVSKVEEAVATLDVVNDIKNNSMGVVSDYSSTLTNIRNYRNLDPRYVSNISIRLENIVISNRKSYTFFVSVMKNDLMKLNSYERIKLLQEINQKISNLRSAIFNISRDAAIKNQQAETRKGLYSMPILK